MNLSVRSTGTWQHTLDIEIPAEEVDRRLEEVARQLQRRASLPGFRKGRVPLDMVRQHYADAVEQEFLEGFVPRITGEAIEEAKLSPDRQPGWCATCSSRPASRCASRRWSRCAPRSRRRTTCGIPVRRHAAPGGRRRGGRGPAEPARGLGRLRRPGAPGRARRRRAARLGPAGRQRPPHGRHPGQEPAHRAGGPGRGCPTSRTACWGRRRGRSGTIEIRYPGDYPAPELAGKTARYKVSRPENPGEETARTGR